MPVRLLAVLSLLSCSASALAARFALGGIPHVQDEQGYLLLARIFTHFARVAPPPVDGLLVAAEFQILSPHWVAIFPPGWPAVLALGAAAGVPWLVNPLLAASLPWLVWSTCDPHLPRRATRLAAGIAALSPGIWTLGASMMSHTLVLVALFAAAAAIGSRRPTLGRWILAGLALALVALTRPFDLVFAGGPLLGWAALRAWRGSVELRALAALAAAVALGPLLLAIDNANLTGSAFAFPRDVYFAQGDTGFGPVYRPGCNQLGFGADRGCMARHETEGHTLRMAGNMLRVNARHFDRLLLGFPGGALLALAGLLAAARRLPALAVTALTVPLGYALYWYHGVSFGARFWHPVYLAALPGAACALTWWVERLRGREWVAWAAVGLGAALTYGPVWRELSDRYWCVEPGLERRVAAAGVERGVVLLEDRGRLRLAWPLTKPGGLLCVPLLSEASGLVHNDPFGEAPILWLRAPADLAAVRAVASRHASEPLYRVNRNLRRGEATIQRWDGAAFGRSVPLE